MAAWRSGLAVDRLELEDFAIELGTFLPIRRADGELVEIAVLRPALRRDVGIDVLARVFLLLREIEDIAVRIVAAVLRQRTRRWPLRDVGPGMLLLHAFDHRRDIVD